MRCHSRTVVDVGRDRGCHTGGQRTCHLLVLEAALGGDVVRGACGVIGDDQ